MGENHQIGETSGICQDFLLPSGFLAPGHGKLRLGLRLAGHRHTGAGTHRVKCRADPAGPFGGLSLGGRQHLFHH